MKKFILILIASCALLSSCGYNMIIDYANYEIGFQVVDSEGNDLLDPQNADNILNRVSINYDGETYVYALATKTNIPIWSGLTLSSTKEGNPALYVLKFGEFSPEGEYHGENFSIDFGDGTGQHKVTFTLHPKTMNQKSVKHEFKFEGKTLDSMDPIFKYVISK